MRFDLDDLHGAKAALLRLLGGEPVQHFASVAEGLRGHRGRHLLASVCDRLGERDEAEAMFHAALREAPGSLAAWQGLAGLYLDWGRTEGFQEAVAQIEQLPSGAVEAAWWRGRALFVARRLAEAREHVEGALRAWPDEVPLLLLRSHVLLEQGDAGAEAAVEAVLARDPRCANARHNLATLRSRRELR